MVYILQTQEEDDDDDNWSNVKRYEDEDDARDAFKAYSKSYYGRIRLIDDETDRVLMKR